MCRLCKLARLLLALLLCAGGSYARDTTGALSLEAAWETALQNNLTLQQQEVALQQLQEELEIQKAGYLPNLALTGVYGYTSKVARLTLPPALSGLSPPEIEAGTKNRYDVTLGIDQPVFTGHRTRHLVASAREQIRARAVQREAVRNRLLLQVGRLYRQIQMNQLQQEALAQAVARADRHLERARNFYLAAQATAFDTLEVANRRLDLQGQLQKLRHGEAILTARLAHALNAGTVPRIPALDVGRVDLRLDDAAAYQALAARNRPEVVQIGFLQQAQDARIGALRSRLFPQLYASAAYHVARPGVDVFQDRWMGYFTAGMALRWRVWDWRQDRREVQVARLGIRKLDLALQQQLRDIRQEVTEVYQQLLTVRDQIEVHRQLSAQERERYRITREHYAQGYATSLDLSISENTLAAAELALRQDYAEWLQLRLQLQFATGTIGSAFSGR